MEGSIWGHLHYSIIISFNFWLIIFATKAPRHKGFFYHRWTQINTDK